MADMCIFCIGTWHYATEENNALVALHKACGYYNLGRVSKWANMKSSQKSGTPLVAPKKGGYKLICDGQGGAGLTLNSQANRCVEQLEHINGTHPIQTVRLVGHSRGSVLAIMIAKKLEASHGAIGCDVFLYDPVKRSYNRDNVASTIGGNVRKARIVMSEDENSSGFKPLNVRGDLGPSNYIRLPGTHGTMTQVTGTPIGKVGYMLAVEWLKSFDHEIPMNSRYATSDADFLREYARISSYNSTFTDGNGRLMRRVNDFKAKNSVMSTKMVPVGGNREQRLNARKSNRFMGSAFMVNDDHYRRMLRLYPVLADVVANQAHRATTTYAYRMEYNRYRASDPMGWKIMVDAGVAPPPAP